MGESKDAKTPGRAEAAKAIETLIRFAGDDPTRAGMADTAERVLKFYEHFFRSYTFKAEDYSASDAKGLDFQDFVLIKNIKIDSFCEHHMLPATGTASIGYIPSSKVPGLGAVTRLISDTARRFTTQEEITTLITDRMAKAFAITDLAITIDLTHGCMTLRNKENANATVATTAFKGHFNTDINLQNRFLIMTGTEGKTEHADAA